jgi:hypothetical protein
MACIRVKSLTRCFTWKDEGIAGIFVAHLKGNRIIFLFMNALRGGNMKPLNMILLSVISIFFLGLSGSATAFAEDELYLCGSVKEVNTEERTVLVQVISEGCLGEKSFKVARNQRIDRFVPGEESCFMIDVNTCPQAQRATIIGE